jgi:hypothetical protein
VYYLDHDGNTTTVGVYDGDHIKAHSALIRNEIAAEGPQIIYRVTLKGPTIRSLKFVLNEINAVQQGQVLAIKITTRDIQQAIDIHSATQYLQVEPEQTTIEGHIHGYLAKQLVNPDEMLAVFNTYGNAGNCFHRTFETMLSTIAWGQLDGTIPTEQGNLLKQTAMLYPELDNAISAKVVETRPAHQRKLQQKERQARQAREVREVGGSGRQ